MKLSASKVDSSAIEQGAWVSNIPSLPGIRIKARGIGNNDYRALQGKLMREFPKEKRDADGVIPIADQDAINGQLYLDTIVTDIDGITENDEVTPIKYDKTLGAQLFTDPDYRVWRMAAEYAGTEVAARRKVEEAAAVKN
jgi:hypothetical protein